MVASAKSLPATWFIGEPAAGKLILALLSRSQSGAPGPFGTCAVTTNPDHQPGGALTGGTRILQVSTGPAWAQAQGPVTVAGALICSVSLTVIGPVKLPGPVFWTNTAYEQSQFTPASKQFTGQVVFCSSRSVSADGTQPGALIPATPRLKSSLGSSS